MTRYLFYVTIRNTEYALVDTTEDSLVARLKLTYPQEIPVINHSRTKKLSKFWDIRI